MTIDHSNRTHPNSRRGVTLVEMLVVVSILLLLFAFAVPQIKPSLEQTQLREGARMARAAFARARYRAIDTGNPVGLIIQPAAAGSGACFSLGYAQVPTLFAGSTTSSTVSIDSDGKVTFSDADDADEVEVGDMIKFNYQGKKYRVHTKNSNGGVWRLYDEEAEVNLVLNDAKFQVFRPPFRSTQTMTSQLPEKVCVDIVASGIGNGTFEAGQTIIILFNTSGMIEQIYQQGVAITPTSPIYLLLGEIATLGTADLGEFWIACGHQTGTIITADVAEPDALAVTDIEKIVSSRDYARQMATRGGR